MSLNFIWRSTKVVPKKNKKKKNNKKNMNKALEAYTLVSDGPDRAFDPHRL